MFLMPLKGPITGPRHVAASIMILGSLLLVSGCGSKGDPDTIAPGTIADLRAREIGRNSVLLLWTAPGDDGDSGQALTHRVRIAAAEITPANWDSTGSIVDEPPAGPAGAPESLRVESLAENRRYYFAVRTMDEASNLSALSNVLSVRTASSDTIPPAAVTTLTLAVAASREAFVAWIAPADDDSTSGRAAAYELRLATVALTAENWDTTGTVVASPSPKPPGQLELVNISGLEPLRRYFVAVRTQDDVENWSDISNVLVFTTPADDTTPPAAVADLRGRLTAIDEITLAFTAPGDDGSSGQAFAYDLRYARNPASLVSDWERASTVATDPPQSAGGAESVVVDSLPTLTNFYFALRTSDEAGLWSDLSNIVAVMTSDSTCAVFADSTGDFPTIVAALTDGAGCTVLLGNGDYRGEGNTRWPATARPRIRSISGEASACVIDFEGQTRDLGIGPIFENITIRNARLLRLRGATGPEVLEARGCIFENVAFEAVGPFAAGPDIVLEDCRLSRGTSSPIFNVDRFVARRCHFENNETRLVVSRILEVEDGLFTGNVIPSGALLRTFHDLTRGSSFRVTRCRFENNIGSLIAPFNGPLEVAETVFVNNTESTILLSNSTRATVRECTFVRNTAPSGSCLRTEALVETLRIERSIFADNRSGSILFSDPPAPLAVSCTDVFANQAGDWTGALAGLSGRDGNFSADPIFCDSAGGHYALRLFSPCAPDSQPTCGRIGALDVGCR